MAFGGGGVAAEKPCACLSPYVCLQQHCRADGPETHCCVTLGKSRSPLQFFSCRQLQELRSVSAPSQGQFPV